MKKKKYSESIPVIDDEIFTTDSKSDYSKSIDLMFNDIDFTKKSDLSSRQINKLTKLYQMAEEYEMPMLKEMCDKFIALRVSHARKGRKEAVQMTQQISTMKRLEALEETMKGVRK